MFRRLNLFILAVALIGAVVMFSRMFVIHRASNEVKDFARKHISEIKDSDSLEVSALNFDRGDFEITRHRPPLKPFSWTVNRFTGEIVAWGNP